jgi:hypothetical protein
MKTRPQSFQMSLLVFASLICIAAMGSDCDGGQTNVDKLATTQSLNPETCDLASETGPCRAVIPRWYYEGETGECQEFIWGGCHGNANNFVTRAACEGYCIPCDLDCGPHQECQIVEGCSNTSCELYCSDQCNYVDCPDGEKCTLQEVQCVRAPCPPIAICEPIIPTLPTIVFNDPIFFSLPINSLRYAVSGYDAENDLCITVTWTISSLSDIEQICDHALTSLTAVTISPNEDAGCWGFSSNVDPSSIGGCVDFENFNTWSSGGDPHRDEVNLTFYVESDDWSGIVRFDSTH